MVLGMSPPLPLYPKTPFPPHQQTQLFNCYSLYIVIYNRYICIYIYILQYRWKSIWHK